MSTKLLLALLLLCSLCWPQRKVDSRYSYQRLICVVPLTGAGTPADPKRPMYAPASLSNRQGGIVAYSHQISDDGRSALVEFVALDRSAFAPILADRSIKVFLKGDSKKEDIEKELKKYKHDFDLNRFGTVMP